jgi:C4-dicarboxylate transporter DctQ subunit
MARVIIDKAVVVLAAFAAALVIINALAVFIDVLLRIWGLNFPIIFEFTEYSLIWITFLSTAWLMKIDGHIRLEIIISRLHLKSRAVTNIISSSLCGILLVVLIWYSSLLTLHDYQSSVLFASVMRPLKWPIEIIIPIGYFFLLVQLIMKTHSYFSIWKVTSKEKKTTPDNVAIGEQL